jgi:hypothetical protein
LLAIALVDSGLATSLPPVGWRFTPLPLSDRKTGKSCRQGGLVTLPVH